MSQQSSTRPSVPYPIESVDNALRLIQLLAVRGELGVTAAARELGVAPSTAHRLFAMLVYRGFAVQNAKRAYQTGSIPAVTVPTRSPQAMGEVAKMARPALISVCKSLEETVHLVVLRGTAAVYVDGIECQQTLQVSSRAGMTMSAHCTAAGKVLLSQLAPAEIDALYPRGLPAVYGPAITDVSTLKRHLASVRKAGFAVSREENERGIIGVAVVLRNHEGRPLGALAAGMPTARCPNSRLPQVARELQVAAVATQAAIRTAALAGETPAFQPTS